jgi:predicted nucleotidyltransferase
VDLRTILLAYHAGPYLDALYEEYVDLLEQHDFDPMAAGAERIGRDAAALISDVDRDVILSTLLLPEDVLDALAADMGGGRITDNRSLLEAYRRGFSIMSSS